MRPLNLPCEGMSRLASESVDRDLGRLGWIALQAHLLYCAACCRFRRQIKLLRCATHGGCRGTRRTEQPLPGTGLPDEVRERIKRASGGIEPRLILQQSLSGIGQTTDSSWEP